MKPQREIKLPSSNEYMHEGFRLIVVEHDPVDFIFTWLFFSVVEILN